MKLKYFISKLSDGPIDNRYGEEDNVKSNRDIIFQKHEFDSDNLIRINVVNSSLLKILTKDRENEWKPYLGKWKNGESIHVDAIITDIPNLALECAAADSPVYVLFHEEKQLLALVHSGKYGTTQKFLAKVIYEMADLAKMEHRDFAADLKIIMSPAICKLDYVQDYLVIPRDDLQTWLQYIGTENIDIIDYHNSNQIKLVFQEPTDKMHLDIRAFNKNLLISLGCKPQNMELDSVCTYRNPDYPSYLKFVQGETPDDRFMIICKMTNKL